jgi:LysM repeat protein
MTDILPAGSSLTPGEYITSPNEMFRAGLQLDGDFVVGGPSGTVWSSGTGGKAVVTADMQADGNLVLATADKGVVWSTSTAGEGARLVIQDDRNLVVYGADGTTVLWSPNCYLTDAEKAALAPQPAVDPVPAPVVEEAPAPVVEEAPAPPPPAPEPRRYTVRPGDSLSKIAREFYGDGNAYMRIAEANGIANPNLIHPGQELVIP